MLADCFFSGGIRTGGFQDFRTGLQVAFDPVRQGFDDAADLLGRGTGNFGQLRTPLPHFDGRVDPVDRTFVDRITRNFLQTRIELRPSLLQKRRDLADHVAGEASCFRKFSLGRLGLGVEREGVFAGQVFGLRLEHLRIGLQVAGRPRRQPANLFLDLCSRLARQIQDIRTFLPDF